MTKSRQTQQRHNFPIWKNILVAAIVGGVAGFCTTPLETVKTHLMVDSAPYNGNGFVPALVSTVQQHGFGSLFSGATARVSWLVPFCAIYLPTYDFVKHQWIKWTNDDDGVVVTTTTTTTSTATDEKKEEDDVSSSWKKCAKYP
jgi:hypothetical protein